MSYAYILSFLLLIGSGAGLATKGGSRKVAADTANPLYLQAQDTVQQTSKSDKKKKKTTKKVQNKSTRVVMKRDVQGASLARRSEEGSHVEIEVINSGQPIRNLDDLQLLGSSGTPVSSNNFLGFDNIILPFEGNIRFKAANKLGTVVYDREVRFVVNDPGRWVLRITL
ncbi:hypothetical protein [Pontibacter vulgaris]|uniref:hypothetical protein n=1 Tax=Pontibacter vulgaris TaxID=2905679 RepID=UPI001FA703F9|nr:hypothetical protein [Pontibacter vulgaris]